MTTIKLKNGSGAPATSDLVQGEPALDLTNKRLYTENASGTIIEVGTNPTSLTTGTFTSTGIDDNATSTAITIDASENVGIGTTSPVTRLEVEGSNSELIRISSSSGNSGSDAGTGSLGLDFFTGSTNPAVLFSAHEDSAATYLSEFSISLRASNADVAPTERMRIDTSGNVGIGTMSPNTYANYTTLTLNGATSSALDFEGGGTLMGEVLATANDLILQTVQSDGELIFKSAAGSEAMRIDSSGNVGIGTATTTYDLTVVGASSLSTIGTNDAALRLRADGARAMQFYTNSTERMRIDSAGDVGIGTTNPIYPLDVVGTLRMQHSGTDTFATIRGPNNRNLRLDIDANGDTDSLTVRDLRDGSDRFTVQAGGNVGIGTTSPTHDLTVGSTGAADYVIALRGGVGGFLGWDDSANTTILQAPNTRSLSFQVNSDTFSAGTEAMRIDSSGNVGIGVTSMSSILHTDCGAPSSSDKTLALFQSQSSRQIGFVWDDSASTLGIANFGNQSLAFHVGGNSSEKMRIDSIGNVGIAGDPQSFGAGVATLQLKGLSSSQATRAGALRFISNDGTSCENTIYSDNGFMSFYTGTSTTKSERMRIDSAGALLIGRTSGNPNSSSFGINFDGGGRMLAASNYGATGTAHQFYGNAGSVRILGDGDLENTNNSYGALSDERLKSNIVDASSQIDDIMAVQVRSYTLNETGATHIGVVAQELEASGMSGLVKTDEEGMKSVKYSILYMKAIKALQEAVTRIETLEAEVAALKGE